MNTSTFLGLNTALRGLLANQMALDTTGHNIANVNTEGYSRQRVDTQTAAPLTTPSFNGTVPGQLGTGVEVAQLARMRDNYIDATIRNQFGATGNHSTMTQSLQQVERIINEPSDQGIAAAMREMFGALDRVTTHPQDMSARSAFARAAEQLTQRFNQVSTQISAVQSQSDTRLNQTVTDINSITTQIATLNTSIRDATYMGMQPNDLLDKRDQLMDELSSKINFSYTTDSTTNEVTLTFGTATPINIVDPLASGGTTAITRADLDNAYGTGELTGGSAYADEHLNITVLPGWTAKLDDLVNSIVTSFNTQNAAGFDLTGASGGSIFDPAGITAATFALDPANNIVTDPSRIAAADSWNGSGEPGNGGNALLMAAMRNTVQAPPINDSWEGYYSTIVVSGLGSQIQESQRSQDSAEASQAAMESRRNETSGVSIDEEMTNMLRFQHAYNASARILTALDDSLETIIHRMGRAGL